MVSCVLSVFNLFKQKYDIFNISASYLSYKISDMFRLICSHHQADKKTKGKYSQLIFSFFFVVFLSQSDDGHILAETCSWLCMIRKLLCLDWIYWTSDYTKSTTGVNCLKIGTCRYLLCTQSLLWLSYSWSLRRFIWSTGPTLIFFTFLLGLDS
jgi:hypothetical protein